MFMILCMRQDWCMWYGINGFYLVRIMKFTHASTTFAMWGISFPSRNLLIVRIRLPKSTSPSSRSCQVKRVGEQTKYLVLTFLLRQRSRGDFWWKNEGKMAAKSFLMIPNDWGGGGIYIKPCFKIWLNKQVLIQQYKP